MAKQGMKRPEITEKKKKNTGLKAISKDVKYIKKTKKELAEQGHLFPAPRIFYKFKISNHCFFSA